MIERIHKDLLGTDGKDKIHIDEIADDLGRLLGDITEWEIGENSNGYYIKYSNGIMICFKENLLQNETTSIPNGNVYASDARDWNFPATFINTPLVFPAVTRNLGWVWAIKTYANNSNSSLGMRLASGTNGANGNLHGLAFGFWK